MNSHHNIISWQGQRFELEKENLLAVLPLGKTLPFLCPDKQMHKFSVGQHKDTIAGCKTTPHDFSGAHWDHFCTLTGTEQGWNQGFPRHEIPQHDSHLWRKSGLLSVAWYKGREEGTSTWPEPSPTLPGLFLQASYSITIFKIAVKAHFLGVCPVSHSILQLKKYHKLWTHHGA